MRILDVVQGNLDDVAFRKFSIVISAKQDVAFKSASTAANFVTGRSTNGLITWKNSDGIILKSLLSE